MKKYALFFILFMSFNLFGQEAKNASNDAFPDFTKMNYDTIRLMNRPLIINKIDSTVDLFPQSWEDGNTRYVYSEHQTIVAQRYFSGTKIIHKEFIKINKGKYHYLENDSLHNNRPVVEGDFIASSTEFIKFDTIQTIDPMTYEEVVTLVKRPKLLKEGEWFEADSVFIYSGHYKNDKREGKWTKMKRLFNEYDQRNLMYQNDSLISEIQLNLVKKSDFNALKKGLIGSWSVDVFDEKEKILNLKRPIGFTTLEFSENGNFDIIGDHHGVTKRKSLDTWTIDDKYVLEINRLGKIERYQLLLVLENRIESIILGK